MTDGDAVSLHAWFGRARAVLTAYATFFPFKTALWTLATVAAVTTIATITAFDTGRTLIAPAIVTAGITTVFVEQQRFITACHFCQCSCNFNRWNILFAFEIFDQGSEFFQAALCQRGGDLILETGDTNIVNRLDSRQFQR